MVVTGKTRGFRPAFSSDEDGTRSLTLGLEKRLERVLFLPFDLETISLEVFSHPAQQGRLFSFSVDAASVRREENRGGQTKISDFLILRCDIRIPFSGIVW